MNKKNKKITLFQFSWIKAVCILVPILVLFFLGSVYDYKILSSVKNFPVGFANFGKIFSGYAVLFLFSIPLALGWILTFNSIVDWKQKKWLYTLVLIFVLFFMTVIGWFLFDESYPQIKSVAGSIAAGWSYATMAPISILGSFLLGYLIYKRTDKKLMFKIAFIACLSCLIILGNKELIKIIWSIPRPSWVIDHPDSFKSVWEPQPFLCFKTVDQEYKDQLKSFFSGHTSAAMCATLCCIMLSNTKVLKKNWANNLIIFTSFGLSVIVAGCRILGKCHFLTDVTWAITICILISYFAQYFIRIGNEKVKFGK